MCDDLSFRWQCSFTELLGWGGPAQQEGPCSFWQRWSHGSREGEPASAKGRHGFILWRTQALALYKPPHVTTACCSSSGMSCCYSHTTIRTLMQVLGREVWSAAETETALQRLWLWQVEEFWVEGGRAAESWTELDSRALYWRGWGATRKHIHVFTQACVQISVVRSISQTESQCQLHSFINVVRGRLGRWTQDAEIQNKESFNE